MYLSLLKNNAQLCVHISKCAFTTSHLTCAKKLKNYRGPTMPWGWRYDGDEWRAKKGDDPTLQLYGPLADTPDWSYADGRPGPLTAAQRERRDKEQQLAERAVQLMNEMKYAKDSYKTMTTEAENARQAIIKRKLKEKGTIDKPLPYV